jgi:hypothetical protein
MNEKTTNYGNTNRTLKRPGSQRTTVTPEQRHKLIEMRAYQLAEKRGFKNGDPVRDWLQAEKDVDARLGYDA